jgi:hypothetical protein
MVGPVSSTTPKSKVTTGVLPRMEAGEDVASQWDNRSRYGSYFREAPTAAFCPTAPDF